MARGARSTQERVRRAPRVPAPGPISHGLQGPVGAPGAALTSTGTTFSTLYRINTATGAATVIGNVGGSAQLRGIAIAP